MERLLQIEDRNLLKGERVEISALFSDIRGFTTASQKIDPSAIENQPNNSHYFDAPKKFRIYASIPSSNIYVPTNLTYSFA
jgi:hypothetical protein